MSYGSPKWRDWVLDYDASKPFFKRALDLGINFFDTADMYSDGESEVVTDVVRAGKALYIGASSMYAYQFAKMLHVSDTHGYSRFVTMQNHYNLVYREEEREMNPLCREEGVGLIPWSPLARGFRPAIAPRKAGERRPGRRATTLPTTCITRTRISQSSSA